jgi:hypothetical protein
VEIQLAVPGVRALKQGAGVIIHQQLALVKQDLTTKRANGIPSIIIAMKHGAETTQTKQRAKLQTVNGTIITAAKYLAIISIILTRLPARTIQQTYRALGARRTATQEAAGITIHSLLVKHNQNACGEHPHLVAGARKLTAGNGIHTMAGIKQDAKLTAQFLV